MPLNFINFKLRWLCHRKTNVTDCSFGRTLVNFKNCHQTCFMYFLFKFTWTDLSSLQYITCFTYNVLLTNKQTSLPVTPVCISLFTNTTFRPQIMILLNICISMLWYQQYKQKPAFEISLPCIPICSSFQRQVMKLLTHPHAHAQTEFSYVDASTGWLIIHPPCCQITSAFAQPKLYDDSGPDPSRRPLICRLLE